MQQGRHPQPRNFLLAQTQPAGDGDCTACHKPHASNEKALLAKAGLKPLILERADRPGGSALTTELLPGFHCPTLAHRAAIDPTLVRALEQTEGVVVFHEQVIEIIAR